MKLRMLSQSIAAVLLGAPIVSSAAASAKTIMEDGAQAYPPNNGEVCVLSGPPPEATQYEVLGRIVATKRTYGGIDELFAPMVREARMIGADAIINLQASQRFKGPLPWRITSPTGDGQAIKLKPTSPKLDCHRVGGTLWGSSGPIAVSTTINPIPAVNEDDEPFPTDTRSSKSRPSEEKVDLYTELLKLDDLRQREILTDEEFQAQKKKLLDRN